MDKRTKEALRYLGYGKNEVDQIILSMIRESFEELQEIAAPKYVYQIYELILLAEKEIEISNLHITSKHLYENLKGCDKAAVFAVTLGTEVDRRLRQYEVIRISKAVVFQACAATFLEEYCDGIESQIRDEMRIDEKCIRPRFSPGYGDFSITHQEDILRMVDAQKRIGLTMTESYMLTPTKSVTALIGIYGTKERN